MSRLAKDINEQIPWQEINPGGEICEGGTARLVKTGEWRSNVPVWEKDKCKPANRCQELNREKSHFTLCAQKQA